MKSWRLTKLDIIENRFHNLYTTMADIEGAISSLEKDVAGWNQNPKPLAEQAKTRQARWS